MEAALTLPDESPLSHAEEILSIRELDERSLRRVLHIASQYATVDAGTYDANKNAYGELLFALKHIKESYGLWDDLTIARAIRALRDPSGW